jgi:hypothetical protein
MGPSLKAWRLTAITASPSRAQDGDVQDRIERAGFSFVTPGKRVVCCASMKLRYRNNVDDMVAFNRYFLARTALVNQQPRRMALIFLAVGVGLSFIISLRHENGRYSIERGLLLILLGFWVVASIAVYLKWKPYILAKTDQNVRKLFRQQPDKIALAEQQLEILDGRLIQTTEYGEFRWSMSAIDEIVETPDHVFLRLGSMRALILPRDALEERELEAFLDDLEAAWRGPPPLPAAPTAASEAIRPAGARPWRRDRP